VTDWSALDGERRPLAPNVGPFVHRGFLEAWWRHHGSGDLQIREVDGCSWATVHGPVGVTLAGDAELTDYHSPLGSDPYGLVAEVVADAEPGTALVFDSLPLEAVEPVAKALAQVGVDAPVEVDGHTMVLDLAEGEYLDMLPAKQRHEVRRKERRFAGALGEPSLRSGVDLFDDFVAMHRSSPGDKGSFMTPSMAGFFAELLEGGGARLDVLVTASGRPAAFAFGFEGDDTYYLYNSAFDPSLSESSPGIVLLHRLIGSVGASGRTRFDFLRGTETYKARLGAKPRALFRIGATA
jgi:CelD/BcsL family acetyltransferase involved in cellulose biosynthesis